VVSLSDVRDCSDERRLAAWKIPRQPEAQKELAEVRANIAAAKVRGLLAEYDEAVDMAREAAARGRHLDDPATEAAALLIQGQYLERAGKLEEAESVLSRAVQRADVAEAYETKVKALNVLVHVVGTDRDRWNEAKALASEARTVLRVLGADPLLEAELDLNLGNGARRAGELEEARRLFESSLAGFQKHAGELHVNTARAESNLGLVLSWLDRFDEAEQHLVRSREALESSLGPSHPSVGTAWNVLGTNYLLQKRYEEAVADYQRALEIQTQNFPHGHRNVMLAHYNVGLGLYRLRRYDEALQHLEASLAVRETLPEAARGKSKSWTTLILNCQLALGRDEDARSIAEALLADPDAPRSAEILLPAAMALAPFDRARARALAEEALGNTSSEASKINARGLLALLDSLDQLQPAQ
jgi:tetratricopeptide (TPR) repeat protein